MENQTVTEMIHQQMDHFLSKSSSINGEISFSRVIEIGSWIGAYAIRQRHMQEGQITDAEMQMVVAALGEFCHESFGDNFTKDDFAQLQSKIVELLKNPSFDQDARTYFAKYYQ